MYVCVGVGVSKWDIFISFIRKKHRRTQQWFLRRSLGAADRLKGVKNRILNGSPLTNRPAILFSFNFLRGKYKINTRQDNWQFAKKLGKVEPKRWWRWKYRDRKALYKINKIQLKTRLTQYLASRHLEYLFPSPARLNSMWSHRSLLFDWNTTGPFNFFITMEKTNCSGSIRFRVACNDTFSADSL